MWVGLALVVGAGVLQFENGLLQHQLWIGRERKRNDEGERKKERKKEREKELAPSEQLLIFSPIQFKSEKEEKKKLMKEKREKKRKEKREKKRKEKREKKKESQN